MNSAMPSVSGDNSTATVPSSNSGRDTAAPAVPASQDTFGRVSLTNHRTRRRYRTCFVAAPPPTRVAFIALLLALLYASQGVCARPGVDHLADGMNSAAVAVAYLRHCEDASPPRPPVCERKLVVDLTLDDRVLTGPVFDAKVTVTHALHQSLFPRGAASDAVDALATSVQVSLPPITVTIRRGAVQVRYGLTYLREFRAALRDSVRVLRTAMSCDDGVTRCPPYKNREGNVVPAPLGLCCPCTSVECALTSDLCNASMRAHFCFRSGATGITCVEEEGITYHGWSVGSSSPYYTINLSASGKGIAPAALQLTTDTPEAQDGQSALQLLQSSGVLPGESNKVNISGRVLFAPAANYSNASTGLVRDDDPAEWLFLPASLVSVSGNDCDKVGISPDYFYSLSSTTQCNAQKGTCVQHQLADYRAADLERIAQGVGGRYIATSLGRFTRHKVKDDDFLLDTVERTGGAVLRWMINADGLAFHPLPLRGILDAVTFDSSTDILYVTVRNNNTYGGFYYVAVGQCQGTRTLHCDRDGVTGECNQAALVAGANNSLLLQFSMTNDVPEEVKSTASCTVALRDSATSLLASKNVSWTVEYTATSSTPSALNTEQCRRCAFNDLRCVFSAVCEWQMLGWTAVAVAVMWTPYAILAYWRMVWHLGAKCLVCRS
ncbi:similar to leishmania major. l411.4-like protein [Leishmania tarentolae]|uniref:Similar to leishmania major. l411.4-like protein n=1 Tax=Leishmania tarentolae TaxID=5689 RepID=A0A640L102_LEITA|nr:similar to leishmania major. l411.4-like protein [Leishmania tarentolae]